ncbi:MAG: SDR family oxidoreductase [Acidobacteria bacterium]|nr:SDR family oxidoreductase [Acidobacteriota bacterium]
MNKKAEYPPLFSLKGRIALVTGGAKHLGHAMAAALAAAGASLIVTSRSLQAARLAATALASRHGVPVLPLALDQTDIRSVAKAFGAAGRWQGRVDILVNNAGGGGNRRPRDFLSRAPRDAEELMQTNLAGTLHCCQEAARIMVRQGQGRIINIASIAGMVGRDRRMYQRSRMNGQAVDYAAAKAGVIGMTRDLAAVLGPQGITVNAISPGGFAREDLPRKFIRDYSARTPLGRMGREDTDLCGAVVFLAADASAYVTGHNLVVDGGFSIWQ